MPTVTVRFFGPARDLAGCETATFDFAAGETVGAVAGRIAREHPDLGRALGVRLAVNRAYVPLNQPLKDGDEIAVIPPVSGGSDDPPVWLTREPIDISALIRRLQRTDAGAVATFLGTVRAASSDGKTLAALNYEAYEEMAIVLLTGIRQKAIETYGLLDAAIVHRLGRIELGEPSIAVVALAAHRPGAFDACRSIVDAVKTDAPIWKQDVWSDGSTSWVDPTC